MSYEDIIKYVALGMSALAFLFSVFGNKKVAAQIHSILEDFMKFRSANYTTDAVQSFTNQKTEYEYDKVLNILRQCEDKTDLQSIYNSLHETAFDKVLDRLLPQYAGDPEREQKIIHASLTDDLLTLSELIDDNTSIREKYSIPDEMDDETMYAYLQEQADALMTALKKNSNGDKAVENKSVKETEKNETQENSQVEK